MSSGISVRMKKISLIRELLNMNSSEFGKLCGYDRVSIAMAERGGYEVSDECYNRICVCFDVNQDWLYDDSVECDLEGADRDAVVRMAFRETKVCNGILYPMKRIDPIGQGERVRKVYEESGLGQRKFSSESGITPSNLQLVMAGKHKLSVRYAEKIEKRFGVGADWLLYGDEKAKEVPCDEEMIWFLKKHVEARRAVREMMDREKDAENGRNGDGSR